METGVTQRAADIRPPHEPAVARAAPIDMGHRLCPTLYATLTREEVIDVLGKADRNLLKTEIDLRLVHHLILQLESSHPEGLRFSELKIKSKFGLVRLLACANQYAKGHLICAFNGGQQRLCAGFRPDRLINGSDADPLIVLVWQPLNFERAQGPRQSVADQPDGFRTSKTCFSAPSESIDNLAELLHRVVEETADDWPEARGSGTELWNALINRCTAERLDPDSARQVFIRCLSRRGWVDKVGLLLVEFINRRTASSRASLQTFDFDEPLHSTSRTNTILKACVASEPKRTLVFVLHGARRIEELLDLVESIRRTGANVFIVVLGYVRGIDLPQLTGWSILQITPSGSRTTKFHSIPDELNRHYSPIARLYHRPEYSTAFQPVRSDAAYSDTFVDNATRWRRTLEGLRTFIEAQLAGAKINDFAAAWSQRVLDQPPDSAIRLLHGSGLFFPALRDLDGSVADRRFGSPIAGAISAYLDGIILASDQKSRARAQLFERVLDTARSDRRLPIDVLPKLNELTSSLALLVSIHLASDRSAAGILDNVGRTDVNLALDLYWFRIRVTKGNVFKQTAVQTFLDHATLHGNAVPVSMPGRLDAYERLHGPPSIRTPDTSLGRKILKWMPDPEIMTGVMISCAITANETLMKRWRAVVPPKMVSSLKLLGDQLRRKTIKIWDRDLRRNVHVSVRLITVADFRPTFPGIHRCHGPRSKAALLPWLSAYAVAIACGGTLPTKTQFRRIAEHPSVQSGITSDIAVSSPMLARGVSEWLGLTHGARDVFGKDLRGEYPMLFERQVAKVHWQLPELDEATVFADFPIALTARPDREKLAAMRVVFS